MNVCCPHGDPTCPCQDGDPCHYEWSGDSPPMECAHCLSTPIKGHEDDMVWWWGESWTSGLSLTVDHFLAAIRKYRHAITTTPEYQRLRRQRQPTEPFRFCDARFAEARDRSREPSRL